MSVITEAALRILLKDEDLDALQEYRVEAGTIVTPSARAYLVDNKIDLLIGKKRVIKNPAPPEEKPARRAVAAPVATQAGGAAAAGGRQMDSERESVLPAFEKPDRYQSLYGGSYAEKPEFMTALRGNVLVFKDNLRIALRGRIDSLEARVIEVQLALKKQGLDRCVNDLEDVLAYLRALLRSEVMDEPAPPLQVFGMDEAEIRDRSHTPKKYSEIPHFGASVEDGEAVVLLNVLRTQVREAELVAYAAFKRENGDVERPDIIQAFNRLSSVLYVMMLRAKTGEYNRQ